MPQDPGKPVRITVTKNGPYAVHGRVPIVREKIELGSDGEPAGWECGPRLPDHDACALCRCGRTRSEPFCDGSHLREPFDGAETARRDGYLERAEKTGGQALDLTFSGELCAVARFCHHGEDAWNYAERSNDPEARRAAVREACDCPSGSLVAWEKTGRAIEPDLEPEIGIVEGPDGAAGALRVKGGIPIESADGTAYEPRNRVTLCRCGRSRNKPFCDGRHRER